MRTIWLKLIILISIIDICDARSIFRPIDPAMPEIITRWVGEEKTYHLRDWHLEEYALFQKFDRPYFFEHLIPDGPITYRNSAQQVDGATLKKICQRLMSELRRKKTTYTDFIILKKSDYNDKTVSGLQILKFKNYPFVLKLFIETPQSFVEPFSKGWQPSGLFCMAGGISRYLAGFTRIKNLEEIKGILSAHPHWSQMIDTPRKWFWLPENGRWIELSSNNIGKTDKTIELPAIYGIIADAIDSEQSLSILNKDHRDLGLKIALYLDNRIDAHIDNFLIEKKTEKIVLIDTEHFATMVGLKEPLFFSSYPDWVTKLGIKFLGDTLGRTKAYRKWLQKEPTGLLKHRMPEELPESIRGQ